MATEKRMVYLDDILTELHGVLEAAKADPDELMRLAEACVGTIIKHFDKFPTVDAVEVVRCKDCKHCCLDLSGRENHLCMRKEIGFVVRRKANDFCSYGERRTDGKSKSAE